MQKNRAIWIGVVMVGLVAAYIEVGRRLEVAVPIPFLLLMGMVVLAAVFGGKRAGLAGAVVASLFIFYASAIGFGPPTLTGGPVQAALGAALMVVVGYFLGRIRDRNQELIEALKKSRSELEQRIEARTAELSAANQRLNKEIEERFEAEESLRTREAYYRLLIENTLDIVTVLNVDGTIRYESPSVKRVLGYEPEELVGRNVFDFIHPEDLDRVRDKFEYWSGIPGRTTILELRFRHQDGSWRVLEAIGNNLLSEPSVAGAIINFRDITERREMEKQVQQQEQLAIVGQMAAGIAHDFNNAMAVIVLYAQLLGMSPNLTAKEKKRVETIMEEGKRAAELTAQILDFGRQTVLDMQSLDLAPFLEEFVKLLRRTLADNIEIEFKYGEGRYLVTADRNRLQQALMNLALNSRDAMPEGGHIRIELAQLRYDLSERPTILPELANGEWVQIIIEDNGGGITEEEMGHIFEPFYTTKEPGKGTGLGLAQVYGIVKQHDGFIDAESEGEKGATFTIILPKEKAKRPDKQLAAPGGLNRGNGELILVVEDNYATQIALMSALESLNYRVIGVKNGREALNVLSREYEEVTLVVSDVMMPEMGGVALVDAIQERGIEVPIVLLTGNSTTEEMALVEVEGRIEWYMKPVSLEKLAQVVAMKVSGG